LLYFGGFGGTVAIRRVQRFLLQAGKNTTGLIFSHVQDRPRTAQSNSRWYDSLDIVQYGDISYEPLGSPIVGSGGFLFGLESSDIDRLVF